MDKSSLIQLFINSGLVSISGAEKISEEFDEVYYAKSDYFLKEGTISNNYLFLEKGCMRAFAYDTEGKDVTTNFFADRQMVFEVSSFFNRTKSRENIQALSDCKGWVVTYEKLNRLFHGLPEFRDFGRSILVKNFSLLKIRMLSMITETAEERYRNLLQNNPEIFQYAALKHVATYLGVTDTSLSRIRKEFSQA